MKKRLRIKGILLFIITLGLMLHVGCGSISLGVEFGELKGIVTDARSGSNIEGVYVYAENDAFYDEDYDEDWDYTSGDGSYSLSLSGGVYDVYFDKPGYHAKVVRDIGITAPFSRSLDVQLTPTATPSPPSPSPSPTPIGDLFASKISNAEVSAFNVMSDGSLESKQNSPAGTGSEPNDIKNVSSKNRLYVVTGNDGDNGQVTGYDTTNSYNNVGATALDSNDGQAYRVVHYANDDRLLISRKGSSPGKIEEIRYTGDTANVTTPPINLVNGDDPREMAINNDDKIIYVCCYDGTNKVVAYNVDTATQLGSYNVNDPAGIVYHNTGAGKRLYVISGADGKIITLNVDDPNNITALNETDVSKPLISVALDTGFNRLFTLENETGHYRIRTWSVNADPPFNEISNPVFVGNVPAMEVFYHETVKYVYASLDNGSNGGGVKVYDAGTFPGGQLDEVTGSPFYSNFRYNRLDD